MRLRSSLVRTRRAWMALAGVLVLAGCGQKGPLERPPVASPAKAASAGAK